MKQFFRNAIDKINRSNRLVDEYKKVGGETTDHYRAHINWGIELMRSGDPMSALEKFAEAAAIAPNRAECYSNWGVALAKLKRLDEAIEKFQTACDIDPEAGSHYSLWAVALLESGHNDEAVVKFEKALALDPNNPDHYVNWGVALARLQRYHDAIHQFQTALTINRYQAQVYFLWGAVLAELNDYEGAIEKFKTTIRHIPKHADAHYFWGLALNRLGKHAEAVEVSERALHITPDKPEVLLNLGDALANQHQFDPAVACYQRALDIDPTLADAYLSWGILLCKRGDLTTGIAHFEKALSLDPELHSVYQHWGSVLVEQGQYREAIPLLEKALTDDPEHPEALLNLGIAQLRDGQTTQGVETLLSLERKDRWNANVHYILGTHFLGKAEYQQAIDHLHKALATQPDFEDAAINLSLALCERGDTPEAIRQLRPFVRKYGQQSPLVNFFYGTVLYWAGDYREALEKYERAAQLDPTYMDPVMGKAEVYLKLGHWHACHETLTGVLRQHPNLVPALFLQAVVLIRQADGIPDAEVASTSAPNLTPPDPTVLYQQALGLFDQVNALAPDYLDSWAHRAYLLGRLQGLPALNQAFADLLANHTHQQSSLRAMLLVYWSKALDKLGQAPLAQDKRAEAEALQPGITSQVDKFCL